MEAFSIDRDLKILSWLFSKALKHWLSALVSSPISLNNFDEDAKNDEEQYGNIVSWISDHVPFNEIDNSHNKISLNESMKLLKTLIRI